MCKVAVKSHLKGFRFYPEINGKVQKGIKQRTIESSSYFGKTILVAVQKQNERERQEVKKKKSPISYSNGAGEC